MNFNSLFFHFSDLRNLLKCKDSMFPCYFLLNIRVTWLNMVYAPPLITMGLLNLKICQNFVVTKIFLTFFRGITTRGKGAGELQPGGSFQVAVVQTFCRKTIDIHIYLKLDLVSTFWQDIWILMSVTKEGYILKLQL